MPAKRKATDKQILDAYKKTNSVWQAADLLGMCGQSVHERLQKLKAISEKWPKEKLEKFISLYNKYGAISLEQIARELHTTKASVACKANELGLTNQRRAKNPIPVEKSRQFMKNWHKENKHPRGFAGKKHSDPTRQMISLKSTAHHMSLNNKELYYNNRAIKANKTKIKNGTTNCMRNSSNPYSRTKSGKRKDLNNTFFRSATEANYARYLNFIKVEWVYEPKEFVFEAIRRGCLSYTPDFYLPKEDVWIEVKGWFNPKSITKIKRFRKYFPSEFKKLTLVGQSKKTLEIAGSLGIPVIEDYLEIKNKLSMMIECWE